MPVGIGVVVDCGWIHAAFHGAADAWLVGGIVEIGSEAVGAIVSIVADAIGVLVVFPTVAALRVHDEELRFVAGAA